MATINGELCRQHAILIAANQVDRAIGRDPVVDAIATALSALGRLFTAAVPRSARPPASSSGPTFTPFAPFAPFSPPGASPRPSQGQARAHPDPRDRVRRPPPSPHPRSPPPRTPPPRPIDPQVAARARARELLGFGPTEALTVEAIRDRKRRLAAVYHPDRAGGSLEQMKKINAAADTLLAKLS